VPTVDTLDLSFPEIPPSSGAIPTEQCEGAVDMTTGRTSYEMLVGQHVSPATLATFRVGLVPTAVPRNTVRRLRVGAGSDIAEIVRRLTERDVALLEIRSCPAFPRQPSSDAEPSARPEPDEVPAGVVVPFRPAASPRAGRRGSAVGGGGSVLPFSPPPDAGGRRGRRPNPPGARG
jgi:hypothetical protein